MTSKPLIIASILAMALAGCATRPQEIAREPVLTPVGAVSIPTSSRTKSPRFRRRRPRSTRSTATAPAFIVIRVR